MRPLSPSQAALQGSQPSWGGKWGTLHSPLTPQLLPGLCILIFFGVNKPVFCTSYFLFCHSRVEQRVAKSGPPAPPVLCLTQDTQSQGLSTAKHPRQHRVSLRVPSPWSRAQQGGWWQQGGPCPLWAVHSWRALCPHRSSPQAGLSVLGKHSPADRTGSHPDSSPPPLINN